MNLLIRSSIVLTIIVTNSVCAFSQTLDCPGCLWPFRQKDLLNPNSQPIALRGNITGTVGDFRDSGTNGRFHAGTDFTSQLGGEEGKAVFSMHAGTATVVVNESACKGSYIKITNGSTSVYYKHIKPVDVNPITNQSGSKIETSSQIEVGTFLGLMFTQGGCSQHVHINENSNTNDQLTGTVNYVNQFVNPFTDNVRPDFIYPFDRNGTVTDDTQANGNRVAEFWRNGHLHNRPSTQLTISKIIDGIARKIVYGKVDIVSRIRDVNIDFGGGNAGGNNGINGVSYEIINSSATRLGDLVETINFNTVPPNDRANYVFDNRSEIPEFSDSRHVYIITNNPMAANGRYDQFWNTGLRIGEAEDWDLSNRGNKDARSISEAAYPDAKHSVRIHAKDITNLQGASGETVRDVPIVIDNYLPYVKEVIVKQNSSNGPIVYHKVWNWDATTGQLNFTINDKPNDATPLGKLWVKVVTSEPMKTLKLTISGNDPGPVILDPTPVANTNNKEFVKEYNAIFGSGRQTITIAGTDLADNNLLTDPAQNSLRLADGTWPTTATQGTDTSHSFMIGTNTCASNFPGGRTDGTTCLYVEYSASNTNVGTNEPVMFTSVVSGTGTITYSWNFGAGATPATATTVGPHTVVYSSTGAKTISLTVTDATGTKTKTGTINVLTTSPSVDFSATPTSGIAPLTVYYSDRSAGTVSSRSWSFPGGSPSISTSANPVVVYNNAGNYDATLTINGSATATKPSIISVNSPPPLTASVSHCSNYYFVNCASAYKQYDFVYFSANISGGSPLYNYYWTFGDGNTSYSSTPSNTYSTSGTFTVALTVTDRNGVSTTASTSISIASITPTITANFSINKNRVSVGDGPVIFTDGTTSTNIDPSRLVYYWDFGTGAYPRYAYTKGPHSVCYDNQPPTKNVLLRVQDPVSKKIDEFSLINAIIVDYPNVSQCSDFSPKWVSNAGTYTATNQLSNPCTPSIVGIENGNFTQVSCDLTKPENYGCVFNSTTPCFGDPWYKSHGFVKWSSQNQGIYITAQAGYDEYGSFFQASEGLFYNHPNNFLARKKYIFSFDAKAFNGSSYANVVDHFTVALAKGLVGSSNCTFPTAYDLPSYPYSVYELGRFDYYIRSSFTNGYKCTIIEFYPPNNDFNQIWMYPKVETSLIPADGNRKRVNFAYLNNFSLRAADNSSEFFCSPDLLVKTSSSGLKEASITLATQGNFVIPSGQTTAYKAGQLVTLKPGFRATSGCAFKASIGACIANGGRLDINDSLPSIELYKQETRFEKIISKGKGGLAMISESDDEIQKESRLTIIPNPANDKITISAHLSRISSVEITIVSLVGVAVETKIIGETRTVSEEFNIQTLSPGVYLVKVKSGEGMMVKKFVKL